MLAIFDRVQEFGPTGLFSFYRKDKLAPSVNCQLRAVNSLATPSARIYTIVRKLWSISTTVRNAERIESFLRVLAQIEGENFDARGQIKFQTLLIQHKLYKPVNLPRPLLRYYGTSEDKMDYKQAEEIFSLMKSRSRELYEDPGLRGRTSAAPLTKMGLAFAKESLGKVKITELGKRFLTGDLDIGEVFFKFLIKWQYPNPDSKDFRTKDGFAIKPFIGVLHLIDEVNKRWVRLGNDPIGINKDEFSLFTPTLIDYKNIKKQAGSLIEYRTGLRSQKDDKSKKRFKDEFKKSFAKAFLGTNKVSKTTKLLKNLKEYGDNTIRYFRLTRYLYIRGGGFYIDLEPRRSIEINKLLATDNAAPLKFENAEEYLEYLADIKQPVLPWETKSELEKIAENINDDIKSYVSDSQSKVIKTHVFNFQKIKTLDAEQLKRHIEELRAYRRELQELKTNFESQDIFKIQEYINALKNIHVSENKKSIELEKLSALALNALNDALEIKPNYPVGDDNEPTFTAPANKPDIECFYEKFNSVCEVTMLTNKLQWINEGQPVMRHVRDFEDSHPEKVVYCLFIAPRLHRDTVNTFWGAVKHDYEGRKQKIVPLSITQFIRLLEVLLEIRKKGNRFTHYELLDLYEQILGLTDQVAHSVEWVDQIPETITAWQNSVLTKQ